MRTRSKIRGGRRVSRERWAEIALAARLARTAEAEKRAADLLPVIETIKAAGATSLRQIAAALNLRGITTPRGGQFSAVQVQRMLTAARWFRVNREWARQRAQQVRAMPL
jgi:hypothetical protein